MNGYEVELGIGLKLFVAENIFPTFVNYIQESFNKNREFWGYDFRIRTADYKEVNEAIRNDRNILDEYSFGWKVCYKTTSGTLDYIFVESPNYEHFLNRVVYRSSLPASRSKWCCPILDSLANVYCSLQDTDPNGYGEDLWKLCQDLLMQDPGFTAFVDQIADKIAQGISESRCLELIDDIKQIIAEYEVEAEESKLVSDQPLTVSDLD